MLALLLSCSFFVLPSAALNDETDKSGPKSPCDNDALFNAVSQGGHTLELWDAYVTACTSFTLEHGPFIDDCLAVDESIDVRRDERGAPVNNCGDTVRCLGLVFTGRCVDFPALHVYAYLSIAKTKVSDGEAEDAAKYALGGIPLEAYSRNKLLLQSVGQNLKKIGLAALVELKENLQGRRDLLPPPPVFPRIWVPFVSWSTADTGYQNHVFFIIQKDADNFRILQGYAGDRESDEQVGYTLNEWYQSPQGHQHIKGIDKDNMMKFIHGIEQFLGGGLQFDGENYKKLFLTSEPSSAGKKYYPTFGFFELLNLQERPTQLLQNLIAGVL